MAMKVKKVLLILLGNVIFSLGTAYFVLPSGMMSGGCTGLALAVHQIFGIPVSSGLLALNAVLFILGALLLGKTFAMTTLISSFAYPLFLKVAERLSAVTGIPTENPFLCMVFAGIMFGTGVGLVLREGASTGGTDILALLANHRLGWSVSEVLTILDGIILVMQAFHSDPETILYSLLFVILYTMLLDRMLVNGKSRMQLQILSHQYEEINQMILSKMNMGSTLLQVEGGYSRGKSYAVEIVVSKRDLFRVKEAILAIDPCAFIIVGQVSEVSGRGFTLSR